MLTVPHTLTGAAIGSLVAQVPGAPIIAFGLGWASHYVLDSVPHWERLYLPHEKLDWDTQSAAKDWPRHIFVQAALDVIIAFIIVAIVLASKHDLTHFWRSPIFWGAIGGFFPDLVDNAPFWNQFFNKLPLFKQEHFIHSTVHISEEVQDRVWPYLGLVTQIAVAVAAFVVIFR